MIRTMRFIAFSSAVLLAAFTFGQGTEPPRPQDPAEVAKAERYLRLINEGQGLVNTGRHEQALSKYEEAYVVELSMRGCYGSYSQYKLASVNTSLRRYTDALVAFRKVFKWDEAKHDLAFASCGIPGILEYAILLAQEGKQEEAKAMYYFALRNINDGSRSHESVPFLVVFDEGQAQLSGSTAPSG